MSTGEEPGNQGGPDPTPPVHEAETVFHRPDAEMGLTPAIAGAGPAPAGVASLDEFSRSLIEIGLIDAAELEAFAADSAEGVLGLSRALVKAGKLTPYQAAAVYQKKSRGLLVGNYLILDKLGQGGMGVVFLARHRRFGRVGALKILPPSFARDRDAVLRFRREVEAAGRLKHPNLVAAQDADEDRGVHFLVMDYVEGRDLDRIVRDRGPMPVAQAVDCLIQAARGLEAAHAQGIIHRDIKPGNLMLDNAGTVRVLDLGLARIVDASNLFSKSTTGRLTQSGMYMGTIDYMAPEQAEDSHRVDHRADIYSLGCTLYYLLTGKGPFPGETVLKRLIAHMEHPAPSLRTARPGISSAVEAAYQKMMAKRPEDRPASMAEVVALWEGCKAQPLEAPRSQPELKVFNEPVKKGAGAPRTEREPSTFALGDPRAAEIIEHELNLEDLVMDVRPEARPAPLPPGRKSAPDQPRLLPRSAMTRSRGRPRRSGPAVAALGAGVLLVVASVGYLLRPSRQPDRGVGPGEVGGGAIGGPGGIGGGDRRGRGIGGPDAIEGGVGRAGAVGRGDRPGGGISGPAKPPFATGAGRLPDSVPIFNGNDLTGWEGLNGYWQVRDGAIVGSPPPGRPVHTFLCSKQSYGDFELRFKALVRDGVGNSGVQFRSLITDRQAFRVRGPQCEIGDPIRYPSGSLVTEPSGEPAIAAPRQTIANVYKPADFNEFSIRCVGKHVTIRVNGITTVDGDFPTMPARGVIAWQFHGGKPPREVVFGDIALIELTSQTLAKPPEVVVTSRPAAPTRATTPQVTIASRALPQGFRANPDAGIDKSGWPLLIVGDRDGSPMILIPGSTFTMGNNDGQPAEVPEHQVRLSTYYIDQHEVTNRQFRIFLHESHYRGQPAGKWLTDRNARAEPENLPVVHVNLQDAEEFASWAGKMIPTEAQWEMAARSSDGRRYPWGNEPAKWTRERAFRQIDPVMTFPEDRSPYGVFDLAGNVFEWTRDWFDPRYYHLFTKSTIDNPTGPTPSSRSRSPQRVVRGAAKNWSVTYREGVPSDRRLAYLGFRCVLAVE